MVSMSHGGSAHCPSLFVFLLLRLSNLIFLIFKFADSYYSNLLLNPSAVSFIIYLCVYLFYYLSFIVFTFQLEDFFVAPSYKFCLTIVSN